MKPVLLSIDPSVRSLGWTVVNLNHADGKDYLDLDNQLLWTFGLVQMESTRQVDPSILKWRWQEAFVNLKASFELDGNSPTHFASEWPMYFDSLKGRIAAQQNYTLGIASMVGYLAAAFEFNPAHIALWTPLQWKGNQPKSVTRNRFVLTFGEAGRKLARMLSDDVIDAIMIARFWLTLYDRKKFSFQHEDKLCHINKDTVKQRSNIMLNT